MTVNNTEGAIDDIYVLLKQHKERIDLLREIVQQQSGLNSTVGDKLVDLFTRYNDVEFRLAQIERKLNEIMS